MHYFFGQIPLPDKFTTEQAQVIHDDLLVKSVEHADDIETRIQHEMNRIFLSDDWRRLRPMAMEFIRVASESNRPYEPLWDGEILLLLGEFDALQNIVERRMVLLDPLNVSGYVRLTQIQLAQNQFDEIHKTIERANTTSVQNAINIYGLYAAVAEHGEEGFVTWNEQNPKPSHPVALLFFRAQQIYHAEGLNAALQYIGDPEDVSSTPGMRAAVLSTLGEFTAAEEQLAHIENDPIQVAGHALLAVHGVYCASVSLPMTPLIERRFREAGFEAPPCISVSASE